MTFTDTGTTADLLAAINRGDHGAINKLLALHRGYLRRVIDVRLDPRLRGRIDPSDVVQETMVVASRRIKDFLDRRPTSFRIWLRRKALEQIIDQRRHHRRQKRDVAAEVVLSDASSLAIAGALVDGSASRRSLRQELLQHVRTAMRNLSENDREVLLLRHAEELSNAEVAEVLGIESKAASARYGRAVLRLSAELRRQGVRDD
jgi:RNA polymerase sigma-70 factor (ECF subfamily)